MLAGVERLVVAAVQLRLVVEGVHLAHAAVEEDLHDAPSLCDVMQAAVEISAGAIRPRQGLAAAEQVGQRDAAESAADPPEPVAT